MMADQRHADLALPETKPTVKPNGSHWEQETLGLCLIIPYDEQIRFSKKGVLIADVPTTKQTR